MKSQIVALSSAFFLHVTFHAANLLQREQQAAVVELGFLPQEVSHPRASQLLVKKVVQEQGVAVSREAFRLPPGGHRGQGASNEFAASPIFFTWRATRRVCAA